MTITFFYFFYTYIDMQTPEGCDSSYCYCSGPQHSVILLLVLLAVGETNCSECDIFEVSQLHFYWNCIICFLFTPGTCKGFAFIVGELPGPLVFCWIAGSPWREREEWQETEASGKTTDEEILDLSVFIFYFFTFIVQLQRTCNLNYSEIFVRTG